MTCFEYDQTRLWTDIEFLRTIKKNNNIRTEQSESSTFASLLFDQGFPNNARLQRHLADQNAIWLYFASIQLLFISSIPSNGETKATDAKMT